MPPCNARKQRGDASLCSIIIERIEAISKGDGSERKPLTLNPPWMAISKNRRACSSPLRPQNQPSKMPPGAIFRRGVHSYPSPGRTRQGSRRYTRATAKERQGIAVFERPFCSAAVTLTGHGICAILRTWRLQRTLRLRTQAC